MNRRPTAVSYQNCRRKYLSACCGDEHVLGVKGEETFPFPDKPLAEFWQDGKVRHVIKTNESFGLRYNLSSGVVSEIPEDVFREEFLGLKKRLWCGELWEDGYLERTVGDRMTSEVIQKYIQHHREEKQGAAQLDLELR